MGHLTPDIPQVQREVWALLAIRQQRLATVVEELAIRTAEPSWAGSLRDGAARAVELGETLLEEAGEEAMASVRQDELVGEWLTFVDEVETSGHIPSLIVTGYAVLGELGDVPARLLEDVSGIHARPLFSRIIACEAHRPLAGLLAAADPGPRDRDNLRRLVRHLNGQLFNVFRSWRQAFHTLGVDGEWIDETCASTARDAAHALSLKWTRADARVFRV
jgi:hypothetical protein